MNVGGLNVGTNVGITVGITVGVNVGIVSSEDEEASTFYM